MSQNMFRGAKKYIITAKAIGVIAFIIFFFLKRGELSEYIKASHTAIEKIIDSIDMIVDTNSDLQDDNKFWQTYKRVTRKFLELSEEIEQADLNKLSRNGALFLCVQCDELTAEIIGFDAIKLSSIGYFIETLEQCHLYKDSQIFDYVASLFPLKHSEKAEFNKSNARGLLLLLNDAYSRSIGEAQVIASQPLT